MPTIRIDARRITSWSAFHDVFAKEFGFPKFYGRNMDAWIDCMSDLADPGTGMTKVTGKPPVPVILCIDHIEEMPSDIYQSLIECAAFVNWREMEVGNPAVLILAFDMPRHRRQ